MEQAMIKEYLTEEVSNWEFIGHPALMQRFVLRNGKEYQPVKRIGPKGEPKGCFGNATNVVLKKRAAAEWDYVEGFAIHRERPIMAFHHAWVTTNGNDAMDPTLDAEEYEYFGIAFAKAIVVETVKRTGYYGLFDTGLGMNVKLMFEMDPELKGIVEAVKPHKTWLEAAAKLAAAGVLALLVLLPHDLHAQSRVIYGADGRAVGNIHDNQRGEYTQYDARTGRVESRATTASDGTVTVYGQDGRVRERIAPGSGRRP
jgi:hypothetical protein